MIIVEPWPGQLTSIQTQVLTGRNTRARTVDIEAAASRSPSLKPEAIALVATGNDGRFSHRLASERTGHPPRTLEAKGRKANA